MTTLKAIPTNVITGFLGVGKSTAIGHLLASKPADQRWAVLVNEFGEVGIDGSVFAGRQASGVFIREVPGGCMCCAAGVPMRVALNALLTQARPDRLLIEPTGLGHPDEVLAVLTSEDYQDVLDLQATLTLVDARKVHDARYTDHPTFNRQLAIADVIVANKADQYAEADLPALAAYLAGTGLGATPVHPTRHGVLDPGWLERRQLESAAGGRGGDHAHPHDHDHAHHEHAHHDHASDTPAAPPSAPDGGYRRIDNAGDGFFSRGWVFDRGWTFDADKLSAHLASAPAERIKGVLVTDQGITAYNKADGVLTQSSLQSCDDSRIECISADRTALQRLEDALLDCRLP